ncbi:MAG: polysaccharide biosynthesis tyrosine autokinase [Phycisphaerae bacterium]
MSRMPVTFQERVPMPVEPILRPGGAAAAAFSASDILRALKHWIFLILFLWIFLLAVVAVGTYLWVRYYPGYVAKAQVLVESPKPQMPYTLQEAPLSPDVQERILMDQALLVKSDDVLTEVLQDSEVINTQWYQSYSQDERPQMLLDLQDKLSVTPIRGTSYLQIAMSCHSPDDPHRIVNSVVEKYLARANYLSRRNYNTQLEKYRAERDGLARQIREIRERKDAFVTRELGNVPGITQGLNVIAEALRELTNQTTRLEAEKIQYKAMYDNLAGVSPRSLNISPQMRMMIENDPKIANLNNALSQLRQQKLMASKRFGEKHRAVREVDAQISALEQQLSEEMAIKEDQIRQYEVDQAQMAYLNATEADLQLQEKLLELKEQQRDLDRQLAAYQAMEEDQLRLEKNYELVSDHARMLDLILSQSSVVRVEPVANAVKPLERATPRWELNLPIGGFLGLVIAVGVALLLEFADTSVRTPRDIVRYVSVPILGTVPDVDDEEVAIDRVEMAAHTSPRSLIAEAFRNIRTNLLLSAPAERQRTVLITSPKPEDGKTTVAANLAISIAQSGRRVLLVDANFRRPAIHQLFPTGSREGLSNALIGQSVLDTLVHSTALPNLDVLLPGPIPPNPAELLGGKYMGELITQAADRYDQVIFDGPPVLLVSDALVLAGVVDGVILVCRAKANSRGVAQRARDQLERVNAHLFGAVLNAAQVRRGGYFREQLRTFYDYQPEELPAATAAALPENGPAGSPPPGGNAST